MNEHESNPDWEDRLVDVALNEAIGGETPPDLSEKILAASTDSSLDEPTASPLSGDQAMNDVQHVQITRRRHWTMLAVAASLLVAVGAILIEPTFREARVAENPTEARESIAANRKAESDSGVSNQDFVADDRSVKLDSLQEEVSQQLAGENQSVTVELPEFESTAVNTVVSVPDGGTVLSSGPKRILETPIESKDSESRSLALGSLQKQQDQKLAVKRQPADKLQMMATPRIITEGEEEQKLGTDAGEVSAETSIATNGKTLPSPYYVTDDVQYYSPGPEFRITQDASSGLGRGGAASAPTTAPAAGAKFGLSGQINDAYSQLAPKSRARAGGRGLELRKGTSQPAQQGAGQSLARGGEGQAAPSAAEVADSDMPARQNSYAETPEQVNLHQQWLDAGKNLETAPASDKGLADQKAVKPANESLSVDEKRKLQEQLLAKKEALVDLEVMKEVVKQETKSPTALEVRIQEEMLNDPQIQNFQAEELAVTQQLTQLKAITKNRNSPDVKRLEEQLRSFDQAKQSYRVEKESELRDRYRSGPNDKLASTETEYLLRKNAINEEISELEGQLAGNTRQPAAAPTTRGEVALQLGEKIVEYQQLASRGRGQEWSRYEKRISSLSSEIEELRRKKRRLEVRDGIGPQFGGDKYSRIYENSFIRPKGKQALSTFSIDVDTASYANTRQFLMQSHQLPPPDAVRLEELINYFDYDYSGPEDDVPFASHVEVAGCPWNAAHRLVRIGIKGHEIDREERPQSNLVFLIDVSGSMNDSAKLPLLVDGMKMLVRELGENDKVAIVVYASSEGLALPSTRGDKQQEILAALNKLRAGGSTAGGAGIQLAYKTAIENFIEGGVNRVILCTDGDFNVGVTSDGELERIAEENAKDSGVFLTVLGFGRGNLNDSMMEKISGKGNGNYHYVDNLTEARKVLVEEMAGTLVTIAKDVKIQVEFNPAQVAGYRLLGYENRVMVAEDFNDDTKDAGEIGAGHTVTALYEIVPAGQKVDVPPVDDLTFQKTMAPEIEEELRDKLLKLRIRYKKPDGDKSTKQEFLITDEGGSFAQATPDFQFASAVASFGMLLRNSEHKGNTSFAAVAEIAEGAAKRDPHGYRAEFLQMVRQAKQLSGE